MNTKEVELHPNEFWSVLNILNEVCHGIKINNFEKSIGAKKQTVVNFMNKISNSEEKSVMILNLNEPELTFLNKSFEEVLREIDECEFQTRIGISMQEINKIKEKLK